MNIVPVWVVAVSAVGHLGTLFVAARLSLASPTVSVPLWKILPPANVVQSVVGML